MYKRGLIASTCVLVLAASGTAFARAGARTFADTYPVASALCVKAHDNTLPAGLTANHDKVVLACNTLQNDFGPLVTTVDSAEAAYLTTVAAQRALVATACAKPVKDETACHAARDTAHSTDAAALATRKAAVDAFQAQIEANRTAFWTTIQGLRAHA